MLFRYKWISYVVFGIFVSCVCACDGREKESTQNDVSSSQVKNRLIRINKILVKNEAEEIENYIQRHKWNMQVTGTGLYYMIYQQGNGRQAEIGEKVILNYTLDLLDGTHCYSSREDSLVLTFVIGERVLSRGLEEGILLMREGDKAKLIIPYHLGYGMSGDENKIPGNSTLVYDVELLSIKDKQ